MCRVAPPVVWVLLFGLLAGCGSKDKGTGGDGAKDAKSDGGTEEPDLSISATELYAAYKADPQAADKRFKGKRLAVTGAVGTRDNDPKNQTRMILFGLKGSGEKNEFVACYFTFESERTFHRLDAKPQPPIIGTCQGAATSEYGKKGARPMEVQLTQCAIPVVPGAKMPYAAPYDKGFADGKATGTAHMKDFKVNAEAGKDTIRKVLRTYSDTYEDSLKNMKPGGVFPSVVDEWKGRVDGYRKAVEPSGVK